MGPVLSEKDRPVGAELIGHHQSADDAHAKSDGEDLDPVFEQFQVMRFAGTQPLKFQHRKETGKTRLRMQER